MHFFKFRLAHGALSDVTFSEVTNPTWKDETDREFDDGIVNVTAELPIDLLTGKMEPEALSASNDDALQQALITPIEAQVHEEILADARAALDQGYLRRAILEAAISCEVALKQALSAKDPTRDYEEKMHALLHHIAESVLGQSFKDADEAAYREIDYLFRCRNRIAHHGECAYRDDRGQFHTVDPTTTREWFKLMRRFLDWLHTVSA